MDLRERASERKMNHNISLRQDLSSHSESESSSPTAWIVNVPLSLSPLRAMPKTVHNKHSTKQNTETPFGRKRLWPILNCASLTFRFCRPLLVYLFVRSFCCCCWGMPFEVWCYVNSMVLFFQFVSLSYSLCVKHSFTDNTNNNGPHKTKTSFKFWLLWFIALEPFKHPIHKTQVYYTGETRILCVCWQNFVFLLLHFIRFITFQVRGAREGES